MEVATTAKWLFYYRSPEKCPQQEICLIVTIVTIYIKHTIIAITTVILDIL